MTDRQTQLDESKTYTCANCGGEFISGWTDEEAQAEADELWGDKIQQQGGAVICEDCFQEFMGWAHKKGLIHAD